MSRSKFNYIHIKTGKRYTYLFNCKIKIKGKWIEGVTYESECGNTYTREVSDFNSKFMLMRGSDYFE